MVSQSSVVFFMSSGEQSIKWSSSPPLAKWATDPVSCASGFCRGPSTLLFRWHRHISPGELLCPVWSYLTDVVVDGVCVPLAHGVAHGVKHAVFVGVDLCHRHVYTVGVVVRSLCSVRWNRLGGSTRTMVNCCSVTDYSSAWEVFLFLASHLAPLTFFMLS